MEEDTLPQDIEARKSIRIIDKEKDEAKILTEFQKKKGKEKGRDARDIQFYVNNQKALGLVLNRKKILGYAMYPALAIAIQFAIGQKYAFPDGRPACTTPDDNVEVCGLRDLLQEGVSTLRVLVAFILGGFVVRVVSVWQTRRTAYLSLCGGAREMIIRVAGMLPSTSDPESINNRETMIRWIILGFELSVLKARDSIDSHEGRMYLKYLGLLKGNEWEKMVDGDRHTTVWSWMMAKTTKLNKDGVLTDIYAQSLCDSIADIRGRANDLMSRLNRDQPVPYSSTVGTLINLQLIITSMWKGVVWSVWSFNKEGNSWGKPMQVIDLVIFFINVIALGILYDLSQILYNPFGPRVIDLPHKAVGGGIRKLGKELTSCDFPSTVTGDAHETLSISDKHELEYLDELIEGEDEEIKSSLHFDQIPFSNVENYVSSLYPSFLRPKNLVPSISKKFSTVPKKFRT
eukprot:CAMPEP_0113313038 /NCGR_PEP_ID=MMETSP0010_2-20120614/9618_1 /TAXON_ID=216773 ORGANISM="Corethron hystrix, Strain 308" /NCGR_SAMPLE_ID=MMETSP0010_2 /ASSEMBLY_ACC=CAM_ASM_000155 /LENGTH=458 /DNA_ID=CAMNT_0000168963 /DNA_START=50 /DNA_END=1426 /DNA_ORIENTATION=- /assembly_acc=CAM_ASM_000155